MGFEPIRVFIVDDSALVRKVLEDVFCKDPEFVVVGQARDGLEALERIRETGPDVVTLDVQMPRMDGLKCLAKLMADNPIPVVMVSSYTVEGAETTLHALEFGAVDFVAKPAGEGDMTTMAQELVAKARMASKVDRRHLVLPRFEGGRAPIGKLSEDCCDLMVVGASTGGPRACQVLLESLPIPFPAPIVVAQHMPPGFTATLAQRLNMTTPLNVKEGEDGEYLKSGWVYVCPAGWQTAIERDKTGLRLSIFKRDGQIYRPSVDITMESAARSTGGRTVAVLLTGMGADGAKGMLAVREAGGITLAESEETCVVFGMPRSAHELGGAQHLLPLYDLGSAIVAELLRRDMTGSPQ